MQFPLIVLGLTACSTSPHSGGDDTGGDAGGDAGAMRPGFTNGVSTLAGDSAAGFLDGNRQVNLFDDPVNVAVAPGGTVVVADFNNNKLRMLTADGTATTVLAQQGFARPFALAFAPDGTLYVTTDNAPDGSHDLMSGTIWRVDLGAGVATPLAAKIGRPRALAVLADGRLAASDDLHHVVELVTPASGAVSVLAGTFDAPGDIDATGAAARFATPYGLVQRADGTLVVCDHDNSKLRVVTLAGVVTTLAGGSAGFADGAVPAVALDHPEAIAQASNGDLFIADTDNFRIRKLSGGNLTTIAGDGTDGYLDDDSLLASEFHGLEGLAITGDEAMLYVADGTRGDAVPYNRVRQVKLTP